LSPSHTRPAKQCLRSVDFLPLYSHPRQECQGQFAFTCKRAGLEAFVPLPLWDVRIGFQPVFQFEEVITGDAAVTVTLNQMVQNLGRRRLLDFRH
jgi:hypothetical protein